MAEKSGDVELEISVRVFLRNQAQVVDVRNLVNSNLITEFNTFVSTGRQTPVGGAYDMKNGYKVVIDFKEVQAILQI